MFLRLQRLSALTGSLLLNLEGPFTALIRSRSGLLREQLGRREIFAAGTIMLGGGHLSFQPGHIGGNWIGGAAVLLGKIAISDWLTALIATVSRIVSFRWKVSNPMLVAAIAIVGIVAFPVLSQTGCS